MCQVGGGGIDESMVHVPLVPVWCGQKIERKKKRGGATDESTRTSITQGTQGSKEKARPREGTRDSLIKQPTTKNRQFLVISISFSFIPPSAHPIPLPFASALFQSHPIPPSSNQKLKYILKKLFKARTPVSLYHFQV